MSAIGIAVPNLNQGRFLATALASLDAGSHRVLVAMVDAGSTDESGSIIDAARHRFAYVRTQPDAGQAAAVNEGVSALLARHPEVAAVGWLNADDFYLPGGLAALAEALDAHSTWVAVTARGYLADETGLVGDEIATQPFDATTFARRCTICQPATLIRRSAWEAVGGLDSGLDMCFDYDLWWRLGHIGTIGYLDAPAAVSRDHGGTKTRTMRRRYFTEARAIVARERGVVPWHWFISDALERETGYVVGTRITGLARMRAGARAAWTYARHRAGVD
ncbi:MAG: glycosyltransferase [Acidobacteria bacterium]|nr:glycosyltransferase [Acidobacteriota bacterium]